MRKTNLRWGKKVKEKEYKNRNSFRYCCRDFLFFFFAFFSFWVPIKIERLEWFFSRSTTCCKIILVYSLLIEFFVYLWKFVKKKRKIFRHCCRETQFSRSSHCYVRTSMEKFETDVKIIFHLSHNKSEKKIRSRKFSFSLSLKIEIFLSQLVTSLMQHWKYDNKNIRVMLHSIKCAAVESFLSDGMSRTFMT